MAPSVSWQNRWILGTYAERFPLSIGRFAGLFCFFLCTQISYLTAEDSSWVLAAEKFDVSAVPAEYADLASAIPSAILKKFAASATRTLRDDELKARSLVSLELERAQAVAKRADLVTARDKIIFSAASARTRRANQRKADRKIAAQDETIAKIDEKITKAKAAGSVPETGLAVTLWKNGETLFTRSKDVSLRKTLADSGISALITGRAEDLEGYLSVSFRIETGLPGIPIATMTETGKYDDVESLMRTLSDRAWPEISRRSPVTVALRVLPEGASVFIDYKRVEDPSGPLTLPSGTHTVAVSADGYGSVSRSYDFNDARSYSVSVTLEKTDTVSVAFDTGNVPLSVYIDTQYIGETPLTASIPLSPALGVAIDGNEVKTFFAINPSIGRSEQNQTFVIPVNREMTKERIEKRRKIFYYSLAGLYCSLPISLLTYGIALDKYTAYNDGKLDQSQQTLDEVNGWTRASLITQGISIGLGVNVAIQLFRYILAANQAVPDRLTQDH